MALVGDRRTASPSLPRIRTGGWLGLAGIWAAGILIRYLAYVLAESGGNPNSYLEALCVWDCHWYRDLVEGGYQAEPSRTELPGTANWAYFPLYPTTVALVRVTTSLPTLWSGFLVSSLCIILAAGMARPLFGEQARAYWLYAFALLAGPFSILFSTLYTESLFILLTTLVLVSLQQGRFLGAGLWAALLSATRVTGVLICFAILAQAIVVRRRKGVAWRQVPFDLIRDAQVVLALAVAPAGLFAYMLFMRLHTGDGLAFAHVQRAWNRSLQNPIEALLNALLQPWPLGQFGMVAFSWGVAGAFALALCVLLAVQRQVPAAIFCALSIGVSLAAGVGSMVRFAAGLAPLGMALCVVLAAWRPVYFTSFAVAALAGYAISIGWLRWSYFVM